jgi:hypothetical protein
MKQPLIRITDVLFIPVKPAYTLVPGDEVVSMIEEVASGVSQWARYAKDAGVPTARIENRKKQHRHY